MRSRVSGSVTLAASIVASPAEEVSTAARMLRAHSRFCGSAGSESAVFRNPGAPVARSPDSRGEYTAVSTN